MSLKTLNGRSALLGQTVCTSEDLWQINQGKQYQAAAKQVQAREYPLEEAVPLLQKIKYAKFDETVEVHLRLGVDPKHADQMVRGTVVMPNGLGKSKKVLVIAAATNRRKPKKLAPISWAAKTWSTRSSPKVGRITTR